MSEFKFGVCLNFRDREKLLIAKDSGADFYELGFGNLASGSEEDIKEFIDFNKSYGLPCPAANGMFPGELKLVGPDVDYVKIDEYLDFASERFSSVGGETVVFGSGNARRCPDGWSYEKATEQLVELCAEHIAPYMRKYSLICAIEPLRSCECNVITSAKRGYEICRLANVPEVKLLIDLFHFDAEKEERETILDYKGYLQHIHIASVTNNRKYPKPDDGTDYQTFFDMLRKADYKVGRISLEGGFDNFSADTKTAFDLLRKF